METAVQVKNSMVSHKCPSVEQLLLKVLHFMKKYSGMFYLVITAKLQTAFDYFFFDCPCDAKSNCAYSLAFLLCPTIAILLWGGIKCCEKRRTDSWMTKCFIPVGWTLLFIFTWIATAFLNENFYLCIASEGSTSNETAIADPANLPCLAEEENESPQSKRKAQMESCSQIIGVALGSVTFVLGIVLSSFSYMLQKTQRSSKKEGRYKTIFKEEQDRVFDTLPKKRARTEIGRQSMNEFTSFTITLNEQGKGSPDAQDKPGSSGEAENQHLLKVGRPIDEERQLLFEKLCLWIDEGVEHGITTLAEIHRKMEELDPSEDKSLAYSPRYLKIKLQEQYEESLYFTSDERRTDIVCLRDLTNAILRDYRQQVLNPSQTPDDAELKELTISTAINLICGDLARVPLDQKQYPSVESMTNTQNQLALIPNSLQKLLKPIVKSDEKVAVWGQNLLKAYRPRSGVMPSQLGLTIQLDHMFGSKWLIDRCHHLGYSESYAELHRYKYCYLNMKNGLGSIDQDIMVTEKDEAAAVEIEEAKVDAVLSPEQAEEQEENSDEMDEGFAVFVPEESTVHKCVGDNIDLNINQLDDKRSEEDTGEFDE